MIGIPAIKIFMAFMFGVIAGKQMPEGPETGPQICIVDRNNDNILFCKTEPLNEY
jgi:hypothetical protein